MSMTGIYYALDAPTLEKIRTQGAAPVLFDEGNPLPCVSVDKAWHAIHYTLTDHVWEVSDEDILSQLVLGGEPVNDEDMGYGPARLLTVETVDRLAEALESWDEPAFRAAFHPKEMAAHGVYPLIQEEDDEIFTQYVRENFAALRSFVQDAAAHHLALVTFIM